MKDYSTLDDLFHQLKEIEAAADAPDPKNKARKIESVHCKYAITFKTDPEHNIFRNQLNLEIEAIPLSNSNGAKTKPTGTKGS